MSDIPELYEFSEPNQHWYYTSADRDIVYSGNTYTAIPLSRAAPQSSQDITKADMELHMTFDCPLAQNFLTRLDNNVTLLTVFRWNPGTSSYDVFWKGRVSSHAVKGYELSLSCESIYTSLRRPGLRARYQKNCRHSLYSQGCGVVKANYAVTDIMTSYSNLQLVIAAAANEVDGWYNGGMVYLPDGSYRYILSHTGNTLSLLSSADIVNNLAVGYGNSYGKFYGNMVFTIYPGCGKNTDDCLNKFNNLDNYGGFPYIPTTNPMGGNSIV